MIWPLLLALAPVPAPERLVAPIPPGFVAAFAAEQGPVKIEERVPRGETVERWTRMVTVQRMAGIARVGGVAFLQRLGAGFASACPGAVATPIRGDTADASVRIDCPLNPQTGKPETMFARAITGNTDLHVVQYAFRSRPGDAEANAASAYLAGVTLCGGTRPAC